MSSPAKACTLGFFISLRLCIVWMKGMSVLLMLAPCHVVCVLNTSELNAELLVPFPVINLLVYKHKKHDITKK